MSLLENGLTTKLLMKSTLTKLLSGYKRLGFMFASLLNSQLILLATKLESSLKQVYILRLRDGRKLSELKSISASFNL